jgi:para-aminobenzoate synthetase component I
MTAPLVRQLNPAPDPAESCERLVGLPGLIFLDSAAQSPVRGGQYSYLTADPVLVLRDKEGDLLHQARRVLERWRAKAMAGLPPFQGGLAGYIGYEFGARLEGIAGAGGGSSLADAVLALYDWVVAWDHESGDCWIISTGIPAEGSAREDRARQRLDQVMDWLTSRVPGRVASAPTFDRLDDVTDFPVEDVAGAHSTFTREEHERAVERVREYILAGDIFQANLSQRLRLPLPDDPWTVYRRLRSTSPAPFAAYLELPEFSILSASPERFLRVDGRKVETRPIKGTRPRGADAAGDEALARELLASVKDRAENVMIVDLLRNDLSRVCAPHSVRVTELYALERWSSVQHLVSTVIGTLRPGIDALHLLSAALPGGSITGAPKIRAMEIISELERVRRGPYCGAIGYLSLSGDMDTSVAIRTAIATRSQLYLSLGGGIVADSEPSEEYRETLHKGRGMLAAAVAMPAGSLA